MINFLLKKRKDKPKKKLFCDIDGTINYHYKRIRKWTLPDWPGKKIDPRAFSRDEILKDEVVPESLASLDELSKYYSINFLSARDFPDAYGITKDWLDKNEFRYNELYIVSKPIEKVKLLLRNNSSLFIDDLQRGHQYKKTDFYWDVIDLLVLKNINFEIYANNWPQISAKYAR
jgi:hypothetical protein